MVFLQIVAGLLWSDVVFSRPRAAAAAAVDAARASTGELAC